MTILSILQDQPPHPDLYGVTGIGGVSFVPAAITPATFLVVCDDGQGLAVTYWSIQNLLASMRQNQFHARLVGLRERSPWAYLLIGGVLTPNRDSILRVNDQPTGWRWEAIQGALLTAQEVGVHVMQLQHAQHVPSAIEQLARRKRTPVKAQPVRDSFWPSPAELILMALPGIGETMAERIAAHCGDAATALQALTDDAAPLHGVGPKTRQQVRDALGLRANEVLVRTAVADLAADATRKAA